MKSTKFIRRALSSFLAAAMVMSLASCNSKLPGGKEEVSNTNQPHKIVNYFTPSSFEKPADLGYIQNILTVNDRIYLYGDKNSDSATVISKIFDPASGEFKDVNLEAVDSDYISKSALIDDSLVVVYNDKTDYSSKIAVLDIASGSVKAKQDLDMDSYPLSIQKDSEGNLRVVMESWGMSGHKISVKTLDISTLEEKSAMDYSQILGLSDNESVSGVEFDESGNAYFMIVDYSGGMERYSEDGMPEILNRGMKISPSGEVVYEMNDLGDLEGASTIYRKPDGTMFILSSNDYRSFFVNKFDTETGDVTDRLEFETGEVRLLVEGYYAEDSDFAYMSEDGIYTVDFETGKSEKKYSFGSELPEELMDSYYASFSGGQIYFYGMSYGDSYQQFYIMDNEGNSIGTIPLTSEDNEYISSITASPDGKINVLTQKYEESDDGGKTLFFIKELNEDGSYGTSVELDKVITDSNAYVEKFEMNKNGEYLLSVSSYSPEDGEDSVSILVLGSDGSEICRIEGENITYINNIVPTDSGDFVFYYSKDRGGMNISKIDREKNELTESETESLNLPMEIDAINCIDEKYDLCYKNSEGVYGFSISENKSTEIINWIDSDITDSIENVALISADSMLCSGYDYETGEMVLSIYKRADENTLAKIQNKTLITLAGMNIRYNENFKGKISEFNRNNPEYRIQMNDYEKYSTYEDDTYKSGAFQLNNDMAAGNIPDIIVGNGEIDMMSFAAKGLLSDMSVYFENDPDMSKDDFFENIFDVYSYDGKLCQLVSNFSLSTIAGPKSKVGAEPGWNHEEFLKLADNGKVFFEQTRENLVQQLIKSNLSEFVDLEKKTCDFDNDRFTGLVDFIVKDGINEDDMDDEVYENGKYNRRFADNECQLEIVDINDFYQILNLQQGAVGEEITLKGYPSESGSGSIIYPDKTFAICEKSQNKDAAWEFIREFFTEEYQDALNEDYTYTFPSRKSSFEKAINKEMTSENMGYSVETPDGETIEMKPLDKVTADKIRTAVETANRCSVSDERINGIIDESLAEVFAGSKTSKDAAATIQNKVSLYLKEIK